MQQVMEMHNKRMVKTMPNGERRLPVLGAACLLGALAGSLCCSRLETLQQLVRSQLEGQCSVWQCFLRDSILLAGIFFSGFYSVHKNTFIDKVINFTSYFMFNGNFNKHNNNCKMTTKQIIAVVKNIKDRMSFIF